MLHYFGREDCNGAMSLLIVGIIKSRIFAPNYVLGFVGQSLGFLGK